MQPSPKRITLPNFVRVVSEAVSPETAFMQNDYPYGRRLRCARRCWLHYSARKGDGFKLVTQTSNPKRSGLVWNAEDKKSTYSPPAVLLLSDEHTEADGRPCHVSTAAWSLNDGVDALDAFCAAFGADFNETQQGIARIFKKALDAMVSAGRASRNPRRFMVSDFQTGELLTKEGPIGAGDPMFAASYGVDRRHPHFEGLVDVHGEPLPETSGRVADIGRRGLDFGVLVSCRLGRFLRVDPVAMEAALVLAPQQGDVVVAHAE